MKTLNYLVLLLIALPMYLNAQKQELQDFFKIKPMQIKTNTAEIQTYDVVLKWQNLDAIKGHLFNCNLVEGQYNLLPEKDSVYWQNVGMARIESFQDEAYQTQALPSLNPFSYRTYNTDFLQNSFYKDIDPQHIDIARWLVSDAIQMQGLAYYVFDSLEYQKAFVPKLLEDHNIEFENWVSFSSRYQKLIWSGINMHNNEVCAIVKFESFYNPLSIDNEEMKLKGRSLYYGEMWISLEDKQVEYAIMVEDVIMKLISSAFPKGHLINLQREIVFNKIK